MQRIVFWGGVLGIIVENDAFGGGTVGGEDIICLELDFWDTTVGAFEPSQVVKRLQAAFPAAEVDPTDYYRKQLLSELEVWSREPEVERDSLVRSSWRLYQTCGPSYRFVVPFPSGHRVKGVAARLSVSFTVPEALPPEHREQLLAFLQSLRMGEPVLNDGRREDA